MSLLSPYRVLDLCDDRGDVAGFVLASLGADVICIEPPTGSAARRRSPYLDGTAGVERSLAHFAYARGKRSVVLDLETPDGREQLRRLAAGADVVITSSGPARLAELGLGPDQASALNAGLVTVSITPFGDHGPKADWEASELTVFASAMPLLVTGDRDRAPVRISVPQAFAHAGAVAAGATLMALLDRSRTGLGQHVEVSAQQAVAMATQGALLAHVAGAPEPVRSGTGPTVGKMTIRFVYPASDGHVSISHLFGTMIGPATARLMDWVHEEGFCSEEMRAKDWVHYMSMLDKGIESLEGWEETKAAVAEFTGSKTKVDLLAGAIERRLVLAPISNVADVDTNEHLAARGFLDVVEHPVDGRTLRAPGSFARFSRVSLPTLAAAPQLGEHTEAVLAEPARIVDVGPRWSAGSGVDDDRVLSGLKVIDLTWSVAAPSAMRVLADFGATVVKVESVRRLDGARGFMPIHAGHRGVDSSALFDNLNAGKLSLSLKINEPEGREVLDDLIAWADVVVDSFSPGAVPRLGLNDERVRGINPSIITMSTSLLGASGPLATFAGYGNLGAAIGGFYDVTGWPDRAPAGPYLAYTDYTSTHLMVVALLGAIDHRRRTGEGQHIELSQVEAGLHYLAPALLEHSANGTVPSRQGNDDRDMAPHGVYPSIGEDRWLALACSDDAMWERFCALLGRPDLATAPEFARVEGRLAQRRELDELVTAWTSARTAEEAQRTCQEARVAAHVVAGSADCASDPQLGHLGHFVELEHPTRRCVVEATRFRLVRNPGGPRRRAPQIGEHTGDILIELLGYDDDRIAALAAAEVLE